MRRHTAAVICALSVLAAFAVHWIAGLVACAAIFIYALCRAAGETARRAKGIEATLERLEREVAAAEQHAREEQRTW